MAETIESFVARLQQEGVESGRRQAGELVAAARAEAGRIVDDARREATGARARADAELRLAARDVSLKLQRTLTDALRAALARAVEPRLSDPDFVAALLRELVLTYARADAARELEIEINVAPEMRDRLAVWALREMREARSDGSSTKIDLETTLGRAGFEYRIHGAAIEITVESVVERLMELVGPAVRELFAASSEDGAS